MLWNAGRDLDANVVKVRLAGLVKGCPEVTVAEQQMLVEGLAARRRDGADPDHNVGIIIFGMAPLRINRAILEDGPAFRTDRGADGLGILGPARLRRIVEWRRRGGSQRRSGDEGPRNLSLS